MTLHRFKKIALLSALGIAAISMNVQAAERIAFIPKRCRMSGTHCYCWR